MNSTMLDLLFSNPPAFVVIIGGIILAIGIHEAAHCYMTDYLGDPTPRSLGRLSLNPLKHLDPVGTLAIVVTGLFGWGKSSPFDPFNLKNPRRDTALIALAGPVSNLILATLIALILRLVPMPPNISYLVAFIIVLNVNLALFNLLPIPPLDGSKIFTKGQLFAGQNSYLWLILLIIPIFGGRSIASLIISPISGFLLHLLIG